MIIVHWPVLNIAPKLMLVVGKLDLSNEQRLRGLPEMKLIKNVILSESLVFSYLLLIRKVAFLKVLVYVQESYSN